MGDCDPAGKGKGCVRYYLGALCIVLLALSHKCIGPSKCLCSNGHNCALFDTCWPLPFLWQPPGFFFFFFLVSALHAFTVMSVSYRSLACTANTYIYSPCEVVWHGKCLAGHRACEAVTDAVVLRSVPVGSVRIVPVPVRPGSLSERL